MEITWQILDEDGVEIPFPQDDMGPPPAVGDKLEFLLSPPVREGEEIQPFLGTVVEVEHTIHLRNTAAGLRRIREAVIVIRRP